jgi:transposase-like protein
VAEELGLSEALLRRWCKKYPETSKPEFRAVEIVTSKRSRPVVITPRGLRVEGLSIEEIAVLLQSLSS